MFGNLGAGEIILILLVVLILFGAKKIPELAKVKRQRIKVNPLYKKILRGDVLKLFFKNIPLPLLFIR